MSKTVITRRLLRKSIWNVFCMSLGAALLTDTWQHTIGLILVIEAVVTTIEGCWPAVVVKDGKRIV